MLTYVGPMLAYLGRCCAYVGPMLASVGPRFAYVGPMLGQLGAMLGIGSGYVGDLGPMLVRCWAVYVENIFRDNFLRFFPPLQAKTVEKPTFFNIAKVQFCAAEGPETL